MGSKLKVWKEYEKVLSKKIYTFRQGHELYEQRYGDN